jgi:hypothetical protein
MTTIFCNVWTLSLWYQSHSYFFRLFAQIRKDINSKKTEPLTIADATSHHAIRQASLKEVHTSVTNMWKGDIYSRSLRNIIRILLRVHLAPARMARHRDTRQRKAIEKQTEKDQRSLDRRFRNSKRQIPRLMDELAMAIINERPASVMQKIGEKLQQSLRPPARDVRREGERDEHDMNANTESPEEEEGEEGEEGGEDQDPESSPKTIRALLSIVRMLIESGKIQRVVTCNNIQHAAFKGTTFTEKEKMVAAKIVNFLRPFVQQRTDDNRLPEPHILTRAPLAALANTITTITGFPSLVQSLSITSQQDLRSLQLTAAGAYDAFHGQWDIPINDASWITNSYDAGKNKAIIFGAFFDMSRMEALMDSHGLQFAWRVIFVSKWTVRLLGKAKPGKTFVKSNYEARRKRKTNAARSMLTTEVPPLDRLEIEALAETLTSQINDLTSALRPLRKEISQLELRRMDLGRCVRKLPWDPGSDCYQQLKSIRQELSAKQLKASEIEKELASAKGSLYALNRALRATQVASGATQAASATIATGSEKVEKEDYVEKVRVIQCCRFFNFVGQLLTLLSSK